MQSTDENLIEEIHHGSADAFENLMQRYQSHVYSVAYSYAREKESALDISQNVFIKVYENLNKFRGKSKFKTWLIRIASNESQNWIKKNRRYQMYDELDDEIIDKDCQLPQEDEFIARENRVLILRSLYKLNTKYRLAVVLRYFENFSIRDIAHVLKCSEGVVKNILFRSLRKLKTSLKSIESGEYQ